MTQDDGTPARNQDDSFDVVVVGGGNAGFSAAHAAVARGRRVLLLEKGEEPESGGNSYYTAGAFRIVHAGLDSVADFLDADERFDISDLPPYSAEAYLADMEKVTAGKNDPDLTEALVTDSQDVLRWLQGVGLQFRLMYERQAYCDEESGRYTFWGGLAVGSTGGGKGLMAQHTAAAERAGVVVRYGTRGTDLVVQDGHVRGVAWADDTGRTPRCAGNTWGPDGISPKSGGRR